MTDNIYTRKQNFLLQSFEVIHKFLIPVYYIAIFFKEFTTLFTHPGDLDTKGWFTVSGVLAIIIYLIFSFFRYKKERKNQRTKVIILLPLSSRDNKDYIKGDVLQQLEGFSHVYHQRENVSSKIDFIILDHQDKYEKAKELLDSHFERGTTYFISTMSQVSSNLAMHINLKYKNKKQKPILIATVTASNSINDSLNTENIFRYYIRVKEEVEILFDEVKNLESAGLIVVPSEYGRTTKELFIEKWNKSVDKNPSKKLLTEKYSCITLPTDYTDITLKSFIQKNITTLQNKDVILITLYGHLIYDTIRILNELNINPKVLLFSSTFAYNTTHKDVKDILLNYNWKCCVPKLGENKIYTHEVVKDFTCRTIDRLSKVIIHQNEYSDNKTFFELWKSFKPNDLYLTEEHGDSKIELQIVEQKDFN